MMKLTIVLFVAALAYTSAKAVADDDQDMDLSDVANIPGIPPIKIPSPDDIKKLAPSKPGDHVSGQYASISSSMKTVNGKVVESKQKGQSIVNEDGKVKSSSFGN